MRNQNKDSDPGVQADGERAASKKLKDLSADALLSLLKKKLKSVGLTDEPGRTSESGPGRKMSEVLLAFIEPYLHYAETGEKLDRLITTAAVAWNASLLPEDKREEFLDEAGRVVLAEAGKRAADDFRSIMRDLMKRKQRLFPRDERVVVKYELRSARGRDQLVVASAHGVARDSKEHD